MKRQHRRRENTLVPFHYRTFRDGMRADHLCFYAEDQSAADSFVRRWIQGRGITAKRIKGKPGPTV